MALNALGIIDASEGEWTAARANFEKALEIHLAQGDHWLASRSLINVARLDIGEGRLAHARQLLHEAFEIARRAGDRRRIAECLYTFAQLSARCGQVQRAMRLVGAAEALYEAIGARHSLPERWFKPSLATLEAEGAAEIAAGRGLSQAEAVREALTIVIPADDS